jgi:hypothetical protein
VLSRRESLPFAVDERVDREEIEREQSDEEDTVVASSSLLDAVPIDELGREEGLELPPSAAGATKKETMEMKDETNGEIARVVLEQVIEGVAIPGQLLFTADAEPLVATADDVFSSGPLDHDPLDSCRGDHRFDSRGIGQFPQQPRELVGIQCL